MLLLLLLACREPGRFVKVVMETRPCALTSTGRVACSDAEPGDDDTVHWVNVPAATDLEEDTSTACSAGSSGVRCFFQTGGRGGHWPEHTPGRYLDVAMSDRNMCTLDEDGVVECVGEDQLKLDGGPYVEIGAYSDVCGLDATGHLACAGRDAPQLDGVYDWMTLGDGDRVCGLADGVPDCWPKDGDSYVQPPEGVTFTDLHLGDSVICGVQTNGELMCWRYESDDCLDPNAACPDSVTQNVPAGTFSQVWANFDRACAVDTDGCVVCWPGDWGWGGGKAICTDDVEPPI